MNKTMAALKTEIRSKQRENKCDTEDINSFIVKRIGDDGRYMTKKRIRSHHCLNFFAAWGVVSLLLTLLFSSLAYLQGQALSPFELVATGGNMFKGFFVGDLLRIEAAFCFISGIIYVVLHLSGFIWLYENGRRILIIILSVVLASVSFAWFLFLLSLGIIEPLSLVSIAAMLLFWSFSFQVQKEKREVDLSV